MSDTYYPEYLKLNLLLDSQHPISKQKGNEHHDETLFIIVHQVYELWFKQILHELNSVIRIFSQDQVPEKDLGLATDRLNRIIQIQKTLGSPLEILETMTPMDFLEFRDYLIPASGFQSIQFREIEIKLGLSLKDRASFQRDYLFPRLKEEDQKYLKNLENEPSLITLVQGWLERVPFTRKDHFDFWHEYQKCVENMLKKEAEVLKKNTHLSEQQKKTQMLDLSDSKDTFHQLFDEKTHKTLIKEGKRKLSQKAILNSLFIFLYRDEPILRQGHQFLEALMTIDENFTAWRQRHALLAHRMLGVKLGTGGSSGHEYLLKAAQESRVFTDLFNLSTYFLPRSHTPKLSEDLLKELNFYFATQN